MKNTSVTVTVIIPTYNRPDSLKRLLNGLASQSYPANLIEVIVVIETVVAGGVKDATVELLNNYQADYSLRYFITKGEGPAVKRNEGAQQAKGVLLVFIDDDIDPAESFIEAHVLAHDKPGKVVIGYLPFVIKHKTFYTLQLRAWWEKKFYAMSERGYRYNYEDLTAGNFSVPTDMFLKENGFNTTLPIREDYELGMRFIKLGAQFDFSFDAWGYHRDEVTNLSRSLKRKRVEGRADVQFSKMHPELTTTLDLYHFVRATTLFSRFQFFLIFHASFLSNAVASAVEGGLGLLEWLRWRSMWYNIHIRLHRYWYIRGLADEFPSQQSLKKYIKDLPENKKGKENLVIDLKKGIAEAEEQIDLHRPESVQLCYGSHTIGYMRYQPGTEHLRSEHLKRALLKYDSWELLKMLALDQVIGKPSCEGNSNDNSLLLLGSISKKENNHQNRVAFLLKQNASEDSNNVS